MTKAAETRMLILQKAFELIYVSGYQATSIDDIIAKTKVTKGAFFYHFKNKDEMGLAVINDLMSPFMNSEFAGPLKKEKDPVKAIYDLMNELLLKNKDLNFRFGCPAGNLTQEMSPLNNKFSEALKRLVDGWRKILKNRINSGKKTGHIRPNVDATQVANMIISGYWGIRNLGKLYGSNRCYFVYLKELKRYLESLR